MVSAKRWANSNLTSEPARYWSDATASFLRARRNALWRAYCDELHADLLREWLYSTHVEHALKTDLFDEASGAGLVATLKEFADCVHGLDLSPEVIHNAQSSNITLRACNADVRTMPYASQSFDLIFSDSTLDHFMHWHDLDVALYELYRLLKPGGKLVITLDNLANPLIALRQRLPFVWLHRLGIVPYYTGRTLTATGLHAYLTHLGFTVPCHKIIMHVPRIAAIAVCRLAGLARNQTVNDTFLKLFKQFDRGAKLPTAEWTGYFVAALAVK